MHTHPGMFARFSATQETGLLALGGFLRTIGLDDQALNASLFQWCGQDINSTGI